MAESVYNSAFTGVQIDEAISDVRNNKSKWNQAVADAENALSGLEEKAPTEHTHDYLSLLGGTLTGNVLFQNSKSTQKEQPNLKWKTIGSNAPYIGFATDQTDGTFILSSLKGSTYASGLAIGGGSGNLLWKGVKVATATDLEGKSPTSHTHDDRYYTDSEVDDLLENLANELSGSSVIIREW